MSGVALVIRQIRVPATLPSRVDSLHLRRRKHQSFASRCGDTEFSAGVRALHHRDHPFHTRDRALGSKRGNPCHIHVSTRALDPLLVCSGFPFGVERDGAGCRRWCLRRGLALCCEPRRVGRNMLVGLVVVRLALLSRRRRECNRCREITMKGDNALSPMSTKSFARPLSSTR